MMNYLRPVWMLVLLGIFSFVSSARAERLPETSLPDTSRIIVLNKVVIASSPKDAAPLRMGTSSVSSVTDAEVELQRLTSVKQLTGQIPNLFIPDYGSQLTSSLYIRGVGSRINTPAVGLYVDDVPVIDKSSYDFNLLNIDRIDVLRGPQGTLYGRNTSGGLIQIYTKDMFQNPGTVVSVGASSRNSARRVSLLTNQKVNDKLAFSLSGFYDANNGFFRNDSTGKKVDESEMAGIRFRSQYRPNDQWKLQLSLGYEYTDQGGYPYYYEGTTGTTESYPQWVDKITANRESRYRRSLFNAGFRAEHDFHGYTLSAITGFQNLGDRMFMDQDFIASDIYTLEQRQKSNTLTQEFVLKSPSRRRWQWVTGLFGMYQAMRTTAPVTFYQDGINMLNRVIGSSMPDVSIPNPYTGQPVPLNMNLSLTDPSIRFDGYFRTPVINGAIYHQSTFNDFLLPRLSLVLGLRLDYERQQLSYSTGFYDVNYDFSMTNLGTRSLFSDATLSGKTSHDYTQLLPKIALQYKIPEQRGNVYASVSKGYRAGGYNIQMFSEIGQTLMQNEMMSGVKTLCHNTLQSLIDNAATEALKNMFTGIQSAVDQNIPVGDVPNVSQTVIYKPEYTWNYEVGAHLNLLPKRHLLADISFFYMDTRNQQISRFTSSGLGRMMVNAGKSHSCGVEVALRSACMDDRINVGLSYGFTHAEFDEYDEGIASGGNDYSGNRVPMTPTHTVALNASYTQPIGKLLRSLTFGINTIGLGRIYWTEANDAYQNFYMTLGGNITADFNRVSLSVWGKNLTQTNYDTFYFESMSRGYAQKGSPFQVGFDLRFTL